MSLVLKNSGNQDRIITYSLFYFVFTVVALFIDGTYFSNHYFNGQWIVNCMAVIYFGLMYVSADGYLKKLMLVMVGLSYIGELIFCKLFGMYEYKDVHIPLYVPLGHSIVYATGYSLSKSNFVQNKAAFLMKWLNLFYAVLFLMVAIFIDDYFSLISGVLFFLLLKRKKWQLTYSCIAFCVIYIELVGTYFGCWRWSSKIFGVIPTVNPPIGAVFYYAGGDVLLAKIVDKYWSKTS